ncbi:MAG: DNA polymerase III subunit gamma/tau [Huintestinicola sp.]
MYQALYRKYRPVTFDDVISQSHITTTLKNQIVSGKTAHAYLFTGSRGTGKTTCARIFAKALNCENSSDGNPCNCCDICRDADNFALSDIIEIDAASNGSINDARELREAAVYTPERCRYKVYIIDEVHMLSKDAFNALLKIIEEPPAHVKFIMATTELHKVLPTILSRCQRFDFMRIKTDDISARLMSIADTEGITLDSEAAALIAKTADGGMRDALSILDRCIAFSENITAEVVSEAAGIAGREYLFSLAECIINGEPAKALDMITELYDRSKDMQRLCEELITQFRNIMIAISAPDRTGIIVCLPSELETIKRIASQTTLEKVLYCLDELGSCAERMSRSLSKRVDMEMCIIKMCRGKAPAAKAAAVDNTVISGLMSKISALEEQLKNSAIPQKAAPKPNAYAPKEQVTDMSKVGSAAPQYIGKWPDIIDRLRISCPSLAPTLNDSYGYAAGGKLLINTKNSLIKTLIRSDENKGKVLSAINEMTGQSFTSVIVGYRAEFDRSPVKSSKDEAEAPSAEQNMEAMLKKAESGGVSIETI